MTRELTGIAAVAALLLLAPSLVAAPLTTSVGDRAFRLEVTPCPWCDANALGVSPTAFAGDLAGHPAFVTHRRHAFEPTWTLVRVPFYGFDPGSGGRRPPLAPETGSAPIPEPTSMLLLGTGLLGAGLLRRRRR